MMRKFDQLTWPLSRGWRLILPSAMLSMDLWVIEPRRRQRSTWDRFADRFLVRLQQSIGHREHLSSDATNDAPATNIRSPLLIIATFAGNQAFIQSGPLTIHSDRLPDRQVDGGFEQTRSTWREASLIQRCSRLGDGGNPAAIRLELSRAFKVGNVANESDEDRRLKRPDPRNGGQNLSFTRMLYDLHHLGFQGLQVFADQPV